MRTITSTAESQHQNFLQSMITTALGCQTSSLASSSRFQWERLPYHLVALIMAKLTNGRSIGSKESLKMRAVCKSWRAASMEYSGEFATEIRRSTELFNLSKILPGVSKLEIFSGIKYYMHPISACSQLSSLRLLNTREKPCKLDLTILPQSLLELTSMGFSIDPDCFGHIKCVHLRRLTLIFSKKENIEDVKRSTVASVHALLKHLPQLQVIPQAMLGRAHATTCLNTILLTNYTVMLLSSGLYHLTLSISCCVMTSFQPNCSCV